MKLQATLPAALCFMVAVAVPPDPGAARAAVLHAGTWLARFPEESLRFDAAIGLHHVCSRIDSEPLRQAWDRALERADLDHDNPMRRFWDPGASSPASVTAGWPIPGPDDRPANTNRPLSEALHCRENGWRPETTAYITGSMRDDGGYRTVHGLWALIIARDNGCLGGDAFEKAAAPLLREISEAQEASPKPRATLEVDLFAERLLMTVLADPEARSIGSWASKLIALQNADGSWGSPAEGEPPYHRYHATMAAAWALAETVP